VTYCFPYVGANLHLASSQLNTANTVRPWIWACASCYVPVIPQLLLVLISPTHRGMAKLCRLGWLVLYQDGLRALRWLPMLVVTGSGIQQLRWSRPILPSLLVISTMG